MTNKTLICGENGDKHFWDKHAMVEVNGVLDTIYNHYQKSKVFKEDNSLYTYSRISDAEAEVPIAFMYKGKYYPKELLKEYYIMLWFKYIRSNKDIKETLACYNNFEDETCGSIGISTANILERYIADDGKKLYSTCEKVLKIMRGDNIYITNGNIFNTYANIIGHQVNCKGVMGKGIAEDVKYYYRDAYYAYSKLCSNTNDSDLLGQCQIIDCESMIIANLFGQLEYGRNKNIVYTKYDSLRNALITLKEYAKEHNFVVALPYNIGCGWANGEWNKVESIIREAFIDYYVILYKFK